MTDEPLDIFHINTTIHLGLWDRVKVLLGRRVTLTTKLPVYVAPEHIGGLVGDAETSASVPPLIQWRSNGGGYAVAGCPTAGKESHD